ncbi:MAG: NAD(P)/FAD-dependent oxidoreductase [Planctomycetota bacterium]|jgi:flavin-dependent dehydrogenase
MKPDFDVVVIGGSYAGACMGILMRRALPTCRVLIVERSAAFERRVGESTSEVTGCFLTGVLGLHDHLQREQITKHGLRMWFDGGGDAKECGELGARYQVRLPTYQLDRSVFDQHLLDLAAREGCEVSRPMKVRDVAFGVDEPHVVTVEAADGSTRAVRAGWVVDASGKAAFLARRRGTWETLAEHPVSSLWARFRNVADMDGPATRDLLPEAPVVSRSSATNHLMGYGWWCWIIPLRGGETSVGLTWDTRLFEPPGEGSIPERLHEHLMTHSVGRVLFRDAEPLESDAHAYAQLAYRSTEVGGDRWAIVGDAAGFMDPLYSQGLDYCSHTVYAVHKHIVAQLRGEDVRERIRAYSDEYATSYRRWFEALYLDKYRYLGDATLMHAAFLLDLGSYFSGPVRLAYNNPDEAFSELPYRGPAGAFFARMMRLYNRRLGAIADKWRAAGVYGRRNRESSRLIARGFMPGWNAAVLLSRGLLTWLWLEVRTLGLRTKRTDPADTEASRRMALERRS